VASFVATAVLGCGTPPAESLTSDIRPGLRVRGAASLSPTIT
jgi:hypothetical protein